MLVKAFILGALEGVAAHQNYNIELIIIIPEHTNLLPFSHGGQTAENMLLLRKGQVCNKSI